jgi:hypothetical protein
VNEPLLNDRKHEPSDAELEQLLHRAKLHWDKLIKLAADNDTDAYAEWKFYTKKSGWVLVIRSKKRNVLYMRPIDTRRFSVTFAFRDKHIEAVKQADIPGDIVAEILKAKEYPEGRMARVDVTKAAECKIAQALLAIKQNV